MSACVSTARMSANRSSKRRRAPSKHKIHPMATHGLPKGFAGWTPSRQRDWLRGPSGRSAVQRGILLREDVRRVTNYLDKRADRIDVVAPTRERSEEYERTGIPFPPPADSPNCRMRRADRVLNTGHELKTYWPSPYLAPHNEKIVARVKGKTVVKRQQACDLTYDKVVYEDHCLRDELGLDDHDDHHLEQEAENGGVLGGLPTREAVENLPPNARIIERKLKTEDPEKLKAQIERYLAGKRTNLMLIEGVDVNPLIVEGRTNTPRTFTASPDQHRPATV